MANILWIQPNQTLALTSIIIEDVKPEDHAKELQERGDVPSDWTIAGYDVEWPDDGYPHEAYRWVDGKVVADTSYVAPQPPEPTKEQLLAQLQALTAKINALGV
jgi:hypothetical protein